MRDVFEVRLKNEDKTNNLSSSSKRWHSSTTIETARTQAQQLWKRRTSPCATKLPCYSSRSLRELTNENGTNDLQHFAQLALDQLSTLLLVDSLASVVPGNKTGGVVALWSVRMPKCCKDTVQSRLADRCQISQATRLYVALRDACMRLYAHPNKTVHARRHSSREYNFKSYTVATVSSYCTKKSSSKIEFIFKW